MAQMTERTLSLIRVKNTLSERSLVQADPYLCGSIATPVRIGLDCHICRNTGKKARLRGVEVDCDREAGGVVGDDEDGPLDPVFTGHYRKAVDQRQGMRHRVTQPPVLVVIWVNAAIPIPE